MFFSTLFTVTCYSLGTFSSFEEKFINQYSSKGYRITELDRKKKTINDRDYLFVNFSVQPCEDGHRVGYFQFYVPYDRAEKPKYTYQVLGSPNSFKDLTFMYILKRVQNIVHMPAFRFIESVKEQGPVYIEFGDESFVYDSKTQARKLFPAQGARLVRANLPLREIKSLLNNLISRNIQYRKYIEVSLPNISKKIYDFISDYKLDNIMTDHEIFEIFCDYYKPYDTYLLYKFQ